jgi:predicted amidophosphoribosyltransferase
MGMLIGRLERERKTMERMVAIYCVDHHHADTPICTSCAAFLAYATKRLEKCLYGAVKPTCARCPIHCYKPAQREQAREVMRYAGPRMLYRHPWLTLRHMADKLYRVEHPMELRRKRRSDASKKDRISE